MMGGFYGMTGVTLTLSPIAVASFKPLVKSLDTSTNRPILSCLKRDLEEMIKFLEGLPSVYKDPQANRAMAKLRNNLYKTEQEKLELEKYLEGQEKMLSTLVANGSTNLSELSKEAYEIICKLHASLDKIKFFYNNVNYSAESSGVSVFGEKLYILRPQSRAVLNNRLATVYKNPNNQRLTHAQFETLKKDLSTLEEYLFDGERLVEFSDVNDNVKKVEPLVTCMNEEYFNNLFGFNLTQDDYYKIGKELDAIGLIGFNVYGKELFDDFRKSVSFSGFSDLYIYKGTDLYNFTLDLRDVVDNYEFLGGGK
ncbi:hypothetical protein [Clostridium paraputrificum]|uniref:Uncharacterized protein n=1 Tax=Clostridium paraputrificum TaxID=29363 RepID=A0A6N3EYW4_9CLOT